MRFTPIPSIAARQALAAPADTSSLSANSPTPAVAPATASNRRGALLTSAENLLSHIPGEASGFYLMATDAFDNPGRGILLFLFVLSFILLVVVRWVAGASKGIMLTTIGAFIIWMAVFDKGFLHILFPSLLPDPLGLIIAAFYSALITILASAGKIR